MKKLSVVRCQWLVVYAKNNGQQTTKDTRRKTGKIKTTDD